MLLVVTLPTWKNHLVWVKQATQPPTARLFCSVVVASSSLFMVFTMKHEFGAGLHLCLSKEPVCCKSALWMSQSSVQSLVRVPKSSEDRPVSSTHGPPAFPFRTSSNQRRRYQMWIPTRTNMEDDARCSPRLAASRFVCRVRQVALHP